MESKSSSPGPRNPHPDAGENPSITATPGGEALALTVLEADQLVAAKRRTRFGRRLITGKEKALLWGLRIYVVVMLIIVLFSVLEALHRAN